MSIRLAVRKPWRTRKADDPLVVGYVLKMFPRFSETFILNEILALEHLGVRVVVFSMKAPNEPHQQADVARVRAPVYVIPPTSGKHLAVHLISHAVCFARSPRRYVSTLGFVLRRHTSAAWGKFMVAPYVACRARGEGVEHFHAHFASGPARQAKLASFLSGIPFSFTAHAKDLFWSGHQHGKNNKLKKRVRSSAFVVTISDFNRRFIIGQRFKVPRRRLVTIYNGLDLTRWAFSRPDGLPLEAAPDGRSVLLAVGRLVPKKGFHVLIEACRLLGARGVPIRCIIAGDGPERGRLEAMIEGAGLSDVVRLVGSVPQDELRNGPHRRAAVLVQPSVLAEDGDQDGIPTVIPEALALGLPVVASSLSGIDEAVIDGQTGLLVPPGDPEALAVALERVISDIELRRCLAVGGRLLMERRFDLKNNAKVLVHLMTSSARGAVRWSNAKLRDRAGLDPLPDDDPDAALEETTVEHAATRG